MSFETAIGEDFAEVTDKLETVRFKRSAAFVETEITAALRRPISKAEAAAGGGGVLLTDVRWHLPASQLTVQPAAGDTIRDANDVTWTIQSVKPATMRTRWECVARIE